jgi:LPXTG-site transpeptidase (sortase) family protein
MWEEDFENGNFDEELMHGVVKYPTTAAPWSQWNSLIFWHSSSEWWKHNEYWFIFRNLPRLQPGQKIQVIWNGQLTTYEMVERKVVNPKEVGNYYHEFVRDWEYYLTLMGCYPIWSSSQRMMVVAKKITNE